jgi:peptide deformylase
MPLKIAQLGQPVLRQRAEEIAFEAIGSEPVQRLIDEMLETMKASRGVGLAAPQVFANRRLFVAEVLPTDRPGDRRRPEVFINPVLRDFSDEKESSWEGCLSFLELLVLVPRHRSLTIDYRDRHGALQSLALEGFPARVVQHEFDHLDGILTIDRAASTQHIVKASEIDDVAIEES